MLAGADEHDRSVRLGHRAQRPAALGGAVHLGDDDRRHAHRVVERLGLGAGLLTHRSIQDQDALVRSGHVGDALQLVDEVRLQGVPTGGVDDDDLHGLELLHAVGDDPGGVLLPRLAVDGYADLFGDLLQLVIGGRTVHVGGDDAHLQTFLVEVAAQLAGGGRLALTVQADHHDGLLADGQRPRLPQDADQLAVDDLDDMLLRAGPGGRLLGERPPLDVLGQLQHQLDVHVGLQQGALDVPGDLLHQRFVYMACPCDLLQHAAERLAKPF